MNRKRYEESADDSVARWIGRGLGGLIDLAEQWPSRGLMVSGDALGVWERELGRLQEVVARLRATQQK